MDTDVALGSDRLAAVTFFVVERSCKIDASDRDRSGPSCRQLPHHLLRSPSMGLLAGDALSANLLE